MAARRNLISDKAFLNHIHVYIVVLMVHLAPAPEKNSAGVYASRADWEAPSI